MTSHLPKHPRQAIREAMIARLRSMIEPIGVVQSWNTNRFRPLWQDEELPAISVYTLTENAQEFSKAPRELKRELEVAVEIIAQGNARNDDTLDSIALLVEDAVHSDETFGGVCSDCLLTGSELIQQTEGEQITGAIVLRFAVTYYSEAPGDRLLPNYEGADFQVKPPTAVDEDAIKAKADVVE